MIPKSSPGGKLEGRLHAFRLVPSQAVKQAGRHKADVAPSVKVVAVDFHPAMLPSNHQLISRPGLGSFSLSKVLEYKLKCSKTNITCPLHFSCTTFSHPINGRRCTLPPSLLTFPPPHFDPARDSIKYRRPNSLAP